MFRATFYFVATFCFLLFVVGTSVQARPSWLENQLGVIDGHITTENEWPMMASVQIFSNHACGGTVWNPNHILTAGDTKDISIERKGY